MNKIEKPDSLKQNLKHTISQCRTTYQFRISGFPLQCGRKDFALLLLKKAVLPRTWDSGKKQFTLFFLAWAGTFCILTCSARYSILCSLLLTIFWKCQNYQIMYWSVSMWNCRKQTNKQRNSTKELQVVQVQCIFLSDRLLQVLQK